MISLCKLLSNAPERMQKCTHTRNQQPAVPIKVLRCRHSEKYSIVSWNEFFLAATTAFTGVIGGVSFDLGAASIFSGSW